MSLDVFLAIRHLLCNKLLTSDTIHLVKDYPLGTLKIV
jgi:hypothetical protein